MESQDNQSPVKVNFFNRLRGAIKKNKDDSLEKLPLSVRFIIKSLALMVHHKHLKPVEDHNFIITIPSPVEDHNFIITIPSPVLEFFHVVIGLFLLIFLVRVTVDSIIWSCKKLNNVRKDM